MNLVICFFRVLSVGIRIVSFVKINLQMLYFLLQIHILFSHIINHLKLHIKLPQTTFLYLFLHLSFKITSIFQFTSLN